ncbi:MAG: Type 1 glutamine amidotransferase-like domain-containing protein [Pseudonocardiaceae bacterium]
MTVELARRRILALGGGGFTSSSEDWPLDEYVLTLTERPRPRICLLPTASGDSEAQIDRFYRSFEQHGCDLSHVSLFRLGSHQVDLREHLLSRDAIYIGGGSMKNLLALWRVHGVDALLGEAWRMGVALCGVSAGSMCWFECGVTRTHGCPALAEGLGLLPGSNSVHYGSDPERRQTYHEQIAAGAPAGWAVEDGVGLVFAGRTMVEAVTAREGRRAFRLELQGAEIVERVVEPRLLSSDPHSTSAQEPISILEYRQAAQRRARPSRSSSRSRPRA